MTSTSIYACFCTLIVNLSTTHYTNTGCKVNEGGGVNRQTVQPVMPILCLSLRVNGGDVGVLKSPL